MTRRLMRPDDLTLAKGVANPQISSDGERVAWMETSFDLEKDSPMSKIMVAASDGSGEPRQFTNGPHDLSPRWSPDGLYLAYLSADDGPPTLLLAPLDGGSATKVETAGPVSWFEWSPDASAIILVVTVGLPDPTSKDPKVANAPRVVRGVFNRLDTRGWIDGNTHLFVYDVASQSARQITSGNYDHEQPSWSPDASTLVFVSDRTRQRHDVLGRGELWTVPASGGRTRRLSALLGEPSCPRFSPDGRRVAVTAIPQVRQMAGRNHQMLVFDAQRGGEPVRVAPDFDRSLLAGIPHAWLSSNELLFSALDRGSMTVMRARIGRRNASPVVDGDTQVYGFSLFQDRGRKLLAFAEGWVDRPGDVFVRGLDDVSVTAERISRASDGLLSTVELAPARRRRVKAHDGLEIEYFEMAPKRTSPGRRNGKTPLYLEIHGGPNGWNPLFLLFPYYQTLVAAGYTIILPNPRGSLSYDEAFALAVIGDWGGEDYLDLMACVDDAVRRGRVDERRLFVGGYSYGGYMSSFIVGQSDRFRAAVIGAPVTNLSSEYGSSDVGPWLGDTVGGDPWRAADLYRERSPITHAPKVTTPVLLHVSDGDLRTPPSQSDEFYTALKMMGKPVEHVRYPGGSHQALGPFGAPPSQNEDRLWRILDFLGRHGGNRVRGATRPG